MSESQIFISDGAGGRGVKMMKNEIGYIWREGGLNGGREGGRRDKKLGSSPVWFGLFSFQSQIQQSVKASSRLDETEREGGINILPTRLNIVVTLNTCELQLRINPSTKDGRLFAAFFALYHIKLTSTEFGSNEMRQWKTSH